MRQILAWADAYHRRTKRWPAQQTPGPVAPGRVETWQTLNQALHTGLRGLTAGDSLAKILLRYRGVRRARNRERLTIKQILAWADQHHKRTGRWPCFQSGAVVGVPGERWANIHSALEQGHRGLRTGYTLATLLWKHRGVPYKRALPRYTGRAILAWADAYQRRHGRWPSLNSGPIPEAPGETWRKIEGALSKGRRGLPGGDSLSKFLTRHGRPVRANRGHHPARHTPLTIERILAWADAFHRREGRWPASRSGRIKGTRDETWASVENALRDGLRGLPGGSSVAMLLEKHRGARHKHHRPRFTNKDILAWADAFHRRTGRWPFAKAGPIPESTGDTWVAVDNALRAGTRGRRGGDSLARFLQRHRRGKK